MQKTQPIAVFDSGVGGLTTLSECVRLLPHESFYYYADNANCPYGEKPHDEIVFLTLRAVERLIKQNPKLILIACNTATAAAIVEMRKLYNTLPIVGTEPAILPATKTTNKKALVMTTLSTSRNDYFLNRFAAKEKFDVMAFPLLAEMVDAGIRGEEITNYIQETTEDLNPACYDTVVLGCTHFLFVKHEIAKIFPHVSFLDGNEGVARQTKKLIVENNLQENKKQNGLVKIELSNPSEKELLKYAVLIRDLVEEKENPGKTKFLRDTFENFSSFGSE